MLQLLEQTLRASGANNLRAALFAHLNRVNFGKKEW